MDIKQIVSRRTDLSTFLVHLTKPNSENNPKKNLISILNDTEITASNAFGCLPAILKKRTHEFDVEFNDKCLETQKCVCFTETPLEYVYLLHETINGRQCQLSNYGIAIPKKVGRKKGINPVWYIDITPGHSWLMDPINALTQKSISEKCFTTSDILKLTPFIEQMGTRKIPGGKCDYKKEFWWEREWRYRGSFILPQRILLLCPEEEHEEFREIISDHKKIRSASLIDTKWGIEQIISRLAGYSAEETDML